MDLEVYYSKIDDEGFSYIETKLVDKNKFFPNDIDYLLYILFEEPLDDMDYKLNNVEVINYLIINEEFILNLSSEIKNYCSSSDAINVKNQIVKTLVGVDNINTVTIYIEGVLSDIGGMYIVKSDN